MTTSVVPESGRIARAGWARRTDTRCPRASSASTRCAAAGAPSPCRSRTSTGGQLASRMARTFPRVFLEEALWIESALAEREITGGTTVLDIGSSTEDFRTQVQPHIEQHVFAPPRRRGATIVHVDAKEGKGVDVVCDVTDADVDLVAQLGSPFDVVLCCNMLEHVVDRERTLAQ